MASLSFKDLFKIAYVRNYEAISYFKNQAGKCKNPANKQFLHFLTGKKREQQLLLEKIAFRYNYDISTVTKNKPDEKRILINQSNYLYLKSLKEIYAFAYEYAVNELDFYTHVYSYVGNNLAQRTLDTLIDLAKDFIFDVRLAYIDFITKQHIQPFETTGKGYQSVTYKELSIMKHYN